MVKTSFLQKQKSRLASQNSVLFVKPVLKCAPGVLSALQRCLLEAPSSVCDTLDHSVTTELLSLLENISLLLLGVLYGDLDACATEIGQWSNFQIPIDATLHFTFIVVATEWLSSVVDAPPSFCDMGNAIRSLIVQASGGGQGDGEECVLLSEEHSLVLTCCWVSLKVEQKLMQH